MMLKTLRPSAATTGAVEPPDFLLRMAFQND
jgi:hypothetical protein